jgi:hypothetical protein
LSVQVLNEFVAVARRKLDKSWEDIGRTLDISRVFCPEPAPLTVETQEQAVRIAEQFGYSVFDSLVIAAALRENSEARKSQSHRQRVLEFPIHQDTTPQRSNRDIVTFHHLARYSQVWTWICGAVSWRENGLRIVSPSIAWPSRMSSE